MVCAWILSKKQKILVFTPLNEEECRQLAITVHGFDLIRIVNTNELPSGCQWNSWYMYEYNKNKNDLPCGTQNEYRGPDPIKCICHRTETPTLLPPCNDEHTANTQECACGMGKCESGEYCYVSHSQCKTFGSGMPTFKEVGGKCDIGGLSLNECQRVADSVYGRESSSIEVEYSNVPFGCWHGKPALNFLPAHGFMYNDEWDEDQPKCGDTVIIGNSSFVPTCLCYETVPATIHPPCNDDPSMKNDEKCVCGATFCNANEYCLEGFRRRLYMDLRLDTFGTEDQCSSTGRFNFIVEDNSNECNAGRGLAMITDKSMCGNSRRMADELGTDVLPAGCWYVNAETGEEGSDLAGLRLDMYWNPLTTEELAPPLVVDYGEAPSFCKADDFAPCPTDGFLTENCVCGTTDLCEPISSSIMMCLEGEDPGARCQPCKYKDENGKCRPTNTKCKHTNGLFPNEVDCQCGNEDCASSTRIEWSYHVRPGPCSEYGEIAISRDDCEQYATDATGNSFTVLDYETIPYGCFKSKHDLDAVIYNDMLSSTRICNDEHLCICKKLKSDTATCAKDFTEGECFKASLWNYGKQMQRRDLGFSPFGCLLKKDTDGYFTVWNTNTLGPVRALIDSYWKICKHEDMNLQILGNYCIEKDSTCIPTDFIHLRGGINGLTCAINEELQMRCHCGDAFCEPGQFCLPDGTCSNDGPCDLRYPGLSHSECTCGFGTSTDRCSSPYYESIYPCPETDRISDREECARAHEYLRLKTEDIYVLMNDDTEWSSVPAGCVGKFVLGSNDIWQYIIVWNEDANTTSCIDSWQCNSHICNRKSQNEVEKPFCTLENDIGTCQASHPCRNVQGGEYNPNVKWPFLNYQCICGKEVCTSGLRLKREECIRIPDTDELCEAAIRSQGLQWNGVMKHGTTLPSGCMQWNFGYNTWNPSNTTHECSDPGFCAGMICADYCSPSLSLVKTSTECGTKASEYGYTFGQIDDENRPRECFIDTHLNKMVWNSKTTNVVCVDNECLRHHCSTPTETPFCDTSENPDGICSNVKLREYPCENDLGINYNNALCQCGTDVCEPAHVFTDTTCTKIAKTAEDCKAVTEMASITFSRTLRFEPSHPSGCYLDTGRFDGVTYTYGVWNYAKTEVTCADTIDCVGRLCMDGCEDIPQTDKDTCKKFAARKEISFEETGYKTQPHGCFFHRYVEGWDNIIRPKIYWNENSGTDLTCLSNPSWAGCHRKLCPPPTKRGYCNAELNVCSVNKNPSCSVDDQFAQIEPGEECPAGYANIKSQEECANFAQRTEIMTVEYSLRETGTCEDDGGTIITDHEECTLAAVELGKSKDLKTAGIANNAGSPPGCLFHPSWGTGAAPQFNNIGEQECGANGYHCICKTLTVNPDETYTYGNGFRYNSYNGGCLLIDKKAYFNAAGDTYIGGVNASPPSMLEPELEGCQCSQQEVCNADARFCDSGTCTNERACKNKDGNTPNGEIDCLCGGTMCTNTTGFFCLAEESRCAKGPSCANTNGQEPNEQCGCGDRGCESGEYCYIPEDNSPIFGTFSTTKTCGSGDLEHWEHVTKEECEEYAKTVRFYQEGVWKPTYMETEDSSSYRYGCSFYFGQRGATGSGWGRWNTGSKNEYDSSSTEIVCKTKAVCSAERGVVLPELSTCSFDYVEENNNDCYCGGQICRDGYHYCLHSESLCSEDPNRPSCPNDNQPLDECECSASKYSIRTSGTCSSWGDKILTKQSECEEYGRNNADDIWYDQGKTKLDSWPAGCSQWIVNNPGYKEHGKRRYMFNEKFDSPRQCSDTKKCICESGAEYCPIKGKALCGSDEKCKFPGNCLYISGELANPFCRCAPDTRDPTSDPLSPAYNPCPASHPYLEKYSTGDLYWCYEKAGNVSPCRMLNSGLPAPLDGSWGTNQNDCVLTKLAVDAGKGAPLFEHCSADRPYCNPSANGQLRCTANPMCDTYKIKTSGRCTDEEGWDYITTSVRPTDLEKELLMAECRTAKEMLYPSSSGLVQNAYDMGSYPTGCFFHANGHFYVNTGAGTTDCGTGDQDCLCKSVKQTEDSCSCEINGEFISCDDGQYCDPHAGKCMSAPPCENTNGSTTQKECACFEQICTAGQYCHGDTCKDYKMCDDTTGENPVSECGCGTLKSNVQCFTGQYCHVNTCENEPFCSAGGDYNTCVCSSQAKETIIQPTTYWQGCRKSPDGQGAPKFKGPVYQDLSKDECKGIASIYDYPFVEIPAGDNRAASKPRFCSVVDSIVYYNEKYPDDKDTGWFSSNNDNSERCNTGNELCLCKTANPEQKVICSKEESCMLVLKQCSISDKFGEELADIAWPDNPNMYGTCTNDDIILNGQTCLCGSTFCKKGEKCSGHNGANPTCEYPTACQEGMNAEGCRCNDLETCVLGSGLYCHTDREQNLCSQNLCQKTDGTEKNTLECACGIADCQPDQYCNSAKSECSSVDMCSTSEDPIDGECRCGSSQETCQSGEYCYTGLEKCVSEPPCDHQNGLVINDNACYCKTALCDFKKFGTNQDCGEGALGEYIHLTKEQCDKYAIENDSRNSNGAYYYASRSDFQYGCSYYSAYGYFWNALTTAIGLRHQPVLCRCLLFRRFGGMFIRWYLFWFASLSISRQKQSRMRFPSVGVAPINVLEIRLRRGWCVTIQNPNVRTSHVIHRKLGIPIHVGVAKAKMFV